MKIKGEVKMATWSKNGVNWIEAVSWLSKIRDEFFSLVAYDDDLRVIHNLLAQMNELMDRYEVRAELDATGDYTYLSQGRIKSRMRKSED